VMSQVVSLLSFRVGREYGGVYTYVTWCS